MSRASAQVKFPDGTIRHGIYNGTVDVFWPPLFDSSGEAWDAWQEYYNSKPMDDSKWVTNDGKWRGDIETVEIAEDYGGGRTYIGRATRKQIEGDVDVDYMVEIHDSLPDWWVK